MNNLTKKLNNIKLTYKNNVIINNNINFDVL